MMKGIVDILKIFLEKYFIPSIIAIVAVFVTYLVISPESWLLQKLGDNRFFVFAFCIWFLIIELITILEKKIRRIYVSHQNKKYMHSRMQEENKEANKRVLEEVWTMVDPMSPGDYELLMKFITNGNQAHVTTGSVRGDSLLNSTWIHKSLCTPGQEILAVSSGKRSENSISMPSHEYIPATYQYKLKDEIYEVLKYSLEKYGKISHFD